MIEHIKTTRSQMIDALCQSMFDDIEINMVKLSKMIYAGFKGYSSYTNEELIAEYQEYISEEFPQNVIIELEVL